MAHTRKLISADLDRMLIRSCGRDGHAHRTWPQLKWAAALSGMEELMLSAPACRLIFRPQGASKSTGVNRRAWASS